MATSQQIITDLEGLGAPPKIIGYFMCLQTVGYITPPVTEYVGPSLDRISVQPQARAPRNRGMSKAAQGIMAVFVPEGMSKRDIVKKTNLTPAQVNTALPTMQKNGYAYVKNSRWFGGPAPAKSAAGRPPGVTKTTPTAEAGTEAPKLGQLTIKAVASLPPGSTATDIQKYLAANGTKARPNHIGTALARHMRGGRLEKREGKWYMPNVEELRQAS